MASLVSFRRFAKTDLSAQKVIRTLVYMQGIHHLVYMQGMHHLVYTHPVHPR